MKTDTLGAFFNLRVIHQVCDSYGLKFDQRIVYIPIGSARLQGVLKEEVARLFPAMT